MIFIISQILFYATKEINSLDRNHMISMWFYINIWGIYMYIFLAYGLILLNFPTSLKLVLWQWSEFTEEFGQPVAPPNMTQVRDSEPICMLCPQGRTTSYLRYFSFTNFAPSPKHYQNIVIHSSSPTAFTCKHLSSILSSQAHDNICIAWYVCAVINIFHI